ncbi:MAG: phosphoribosylformylglycinamidine synthase subunit PurQ [Thermoproteota archaeon]|nr:phosphoribosylformylglycinamidine synthase subunit PurQ [Thermoproteota archaeon]
MAKIGLVVFPGSNCDRDIYHVLTNILSLKTEYLWHKTESINKFDAIILPGGFSYGDRLRAGIIAAHSPILGQIKKLAERGLPVLGICNGFQILVESGMLPGALLMNKGLHFVCKWARMEVLNTSTPFTSMLNDSEPINIPVAHGEGRYTVDQDTYEKLKKNKQIVFKYKGENPNGSIDSIAGVCNYEGNVLGMMPHPERASEQILMPDGLTNNAILIFKSLMHFLSREKQLIQRR